MKVLVTGARGFVGFSLADWAVRSGCEVWGIGRTSQPPAKWPGGYSWADVAHSDLTPIIENFAPDVVFHGAGSASVGESFQAPLDDFRSSALTLVNLLDSVRRSSLRPVIIFPSSAAVYGNPAHLPVVEEAAIMPISPYGFHKLQCEIVAREYAECFGLDIVIGRLFSVFGSRQERLVVWEIFKQFQSENSQVQLQGTGEETRDFLHVDEVSRIMMDLAGQKAQRRGTGLEIYNVASGVETSILSLAEMMGGLLNCHKPILKSESGRRGDPVCWRADITKIQNILAKRDEGVLRMHLSQVMNDWEIFSTPGR